MAALRIRGFRPGHIIIEERPSNWASAIIHDAGQQDGDALFEYFNDTVNFNHVLKQMVRRLLQAYPDWLREFNAEAELYSRRNR